MRPSRWVVPACLLLALAAGCKRATVAVPAPAVRAEPSPVYRADLSKAWSRVAPKGSAADPGKELKEWLRGRVQKKIFAAEEKKALAGTLLLSGWGSAFPAGGAWQVPASLAGHRAALDRLRQEDKKPSAFGPPGSVTLDRSSGGSSFSPAGSTGSWTREFRRGFRASADDASGGLKGMRSELEKVARSAGATVTDPREESEGGRVTAFAFRYTIGPNDGKVRCAVEGSEADGYLLKVHIEEKVE